MIPSDSVIKKSGVPWPWFNIPIKSQLKAKAKSDIEIVLCKNVIINLPTVFTVCLLQALCKLSELDSSEVSKEYKDPTDAYVVGDVVRGNWIVSLLLI